MRLPSEFLDRVRDHFRVSEIVGKYVPIKRVGREYQACCPFHNEKTPSFTINDTKGFYHCFGCGAHGDTIGFIKDYEKLTYIEAVERLAGMAGLEVPKMDARTQEVYDAQQKLYEACTLAAKWFVMQLNSPQAQGARDYLAKRGLSADTQRRFMIGYAPADKNALREYLHAQGVRPKEAAAAGLLIEGSYGEPYSRFYDRIMFPITDTKNRVLAFGGRAMPDAPTTGPGSAKYINSPETELFKKGQMLFNAATARKAVSQDAQTLVVCEGYMDVIALAQAGHDAAVAALGTAMTPHHLNMIWRMSKEPVLCLDGDAAGLRAMQRALDLALPLLAPEAGLKFALLPDKHDPDSLVKERGLPAFTALIEQASPASQMMWQMGLKEFGGATPEARARLEDALMKQANKVENQTSQRHLRDFFRQQIRNLAFEMSRGGKKGQTGTRPMNPRAAKAGAALVPPAQGSSLHHAQEALLCFVLAAPELLHVSEVEEVLGHMHVHDEPLAELQRSLLECYGRHHDEPNEVLIDAVKQEVMQGMSAAMQQKVHYALPKAVTAQEDADLRRLALSSHWQKLHEAHHMAALEEEMKALALDMAGEGAEAAFERMAEVQAEIGRLQARRFALEQLD